MLSNSFAHPLHTLSYWKKSLIEIDALMFGFHSQMTFKGCLIIIKGNEGNESDYHFFVYFLKIRCKENKDMKN